MLTAVTHHSTEPQTRPHAGISLRQGQIALLLVGLMFLAVQLVIVRHPLGLSQDEANYLAKVDPRVPELYWTQPRAWGMPVLAAPVAVFSPSLMIYRLYFGFLSSAGLIAAFWPWLRPTALRLRRRRPCSFPPSGSRLSSGRWSCPTCTWGSVR